jgi:hypothetical protein
MIYALVEFKEDQSIESNGRIVGAAKRLSELIESEPVQYQLENEVIADVKARHAAASERYGPAALIGAVGACQTMKMVESIRHELVKAAEYDIQISSDNALPALCGEGAPALPEEDDDCAPVLRGPGS